MICHSDSGSMFNTSRGRRDVNVRLHRVRVENRWGGRLRAGSRGHLGGRAADGRGGAYAWGVGVPAGRTGRTAPGAVLRFAAGCPRLPYDMSGARQKPGR